MEHKNPLFDCLRHVNLVTDRDMSPIMIDAVSEGINFSMTYMFEKLPTVRIRYIEDYDITHDQIAGLDVYKRINSASTSEIFDFMDTNIYLGDNELTLNDAYTNGTSSTNFFCYPAVRMINIPIKKIINLTDNPVHEIKYVTAHEVLHMHPLYSKPEPHCSDKKCLMYYSSNNRSSLLFLKLCSKCRKKLHRFNSDMNFRRDITTRVMQYKIQEHAQQPFAEYCQQKNLTPAQMRASKKIVLEMIDRIKLYYQQLWLDIPR